MLDAHQLLSELKSELDEAEEKRLYHYKRVKPFKVVFHGIFYLFLGAIAYAVYDMDQGREVLGMAWIPFIIMLIVYGTKYDFEKGKFKYHFQEHVISKIIPKLGPGFTYQSRGGFPENRLLESRLFSDFSKYLTEDFVSGQLNGRTISFSETKLEYRGGGSDSKTRTVFNGIYAELKLSSRFADACWLMPKGKKINPQKKAKRIQLDEAEMKVLVKYRLYSENEDFAKQLFTEDILKRLMTVNNDLRSKKVISGHIRFAFIENTIRLAFNLQHKFMEPDLAKPVNTEAYLQKELSLLFELAQLATIV